MSQQTWMTSPPRENSAAPWGWLRVLGVGLGLFLLTTVVLFLTGNPNLYPTVILMGNFLIPVVYVAYLYDHQHLSALTLPQVAHSFFVGGVLGVLGASLLEPLLIAPTNANGGLTLSAALLVGLIEEGCKILAVLWVARRAQSFSEMDGLLTGAAVGMGFAALESTGYAFTVFLQSGGAVGTSLIETVLRGLLAPFGHGTWTAILAAVLFRDSGPRHFRLTGGVLLSYLFVSLLHGLWDGLPRTWVILLPPGIPISVVTLTLSVVGLAVLYRLYRQALTARS